MSIGFIIERNNKMTDNKVTFKNNGKLKLLIIVGTRPIGANLSN